MHRSLGKVSGYVIGFGSLFAIWHLASVYLLNSILFPPPARVVVKAVELAQDGTLWENASISLQRIALGFFFGSMIGIPLGLAIGSFGIVRRMLEPYTEFLRFIPATALITVAVIWFGIGEGSKIFLIIYTTRVHRHHQHGGRRERCGAQQDPRRAIARRQPRAGVPVRRPAGHRALSSSPACVSPWATRSSPSSLPSWLRPMPGLAR